MILSKHLTSISIVLHFCHLFYGRQIHIKPNLLILKIGIYIAIISFHCLHVISFHCFKQLQIRRFIRQIVLTFVFLYKNVHAPQFQISSFFFLFFFFKRNLMTFLLRKICGYPLLLVHLSLQCSRWAIVVGQCPSCIIPAASSSCNINNFL